VKYKWRFLFGWVITFVGLIIIPQSALAYTYPGSGDTNDSGFKWIFILLAILVIGIAVTAYIKRRQANRISGASSGQNRNGMPPTIKVSSVVEEKLLPGEKAIRQISSGRSDFVATDKRLLRFSAAGCEPIEYAKMSDVSYKTSPGKILAVRIIIGFCVLVMVWVTGVIWISAFDSSVSNVSVTDAIIITLVCIGVIALGLLGASRDFGYYQIESQTYDQATLKPWRITRPPGYWGNAGVDEFIKTMKERITTQN